MLNTKTNKGRTVQGQRDSEPCARSFGELDPDNRRGGNLKETEENLRACLENAPDGVYLSDVSGTFLYGNKKAEEISGYKREELLGTSFLETGILPAKYIPKAVKLLALNAIGKPTGPDEFELIKKDGTSIFVEVNTTPVKQSGKKVVVGFIRDITERKRKEEQLTYQAELLDSQVDEIMVHDFEGNLIYLNQSAALQHGYTNEELLNMNLRQLTTPETERVMQARMEEIVEKGRASFVVTHFRKDGTRLPLEIHAQVAEKGGKKLVFSVARDITERLRAEDALRASEQNFRNSLENSPLGVAIYDMEFNCIYINQMLIDIYGFSSVEEYQTTPIEKCYTPESYATYLERHEKVRRGDMTAISFELNIIRKDGVVRTLQVNRKNTTWENKPVFEYLYNDVTERKQAEIEKEKTVKLLQTLIDAIPVPVFYKDTKGIYLGCNDAYTRFMQLPREAFIGRDVYGISPKPLADADNQRDTELLNNPGTQVYEFQTKSTDGKTHNVIFHKATFQDKDGSMAGLVGAILDITEQKNAQAELQEFNQQLQAIINSSPMGILIIDKSGTVQMWNPACEHIFGWTSEEVIGKFLPFVPDNKRNEFEEIRETLISGKTIRGLELIRCRKDNIPLCINLAASPLYNGSGVPERILAVVEDITERKRTENELNASEERFRRLADNAQDLIYRFRILPAPGFEYVSPSATAITGYSPEEHYADPALMIKNVHPDDVHLLMDEQSNPKDFLGKSIVLRVTRKDGTTIWTEHRQAQIHDEQGKLIAIEGIARDITQQIMMDKLLRESENNFRNLLDESPFGIFIITPDYKPLYTNRVFLEIFGYRDKSEVESKLPYNFYAPQSYAEYLKRKELSLENKLALHYEIEIIRRDGSVRYLDVIHKSIMWNGQPGIQATYRDITDIRLAQKELNEKEIRYRELVETIPSGLAVYEAMEDGNDFRFKEFNHTAEVIEKIDRNKVLGKRVTEVFPGVKEMGLFEVLRRVWQSGRSEFVQPAVYSAEGVPPSWRENWVYKIPSGEIVAVYNDVTERSQKEIELRESEERYRSLFQNMLNGFAYCRMIYDGETPTDFVYLKTNSAFETLTGLKDVVGKPVSRVIPGIRESDPEIFEIYGKVARTGIPASLEIFVEALQMWFSISVYSPGLGYFVAVFDVITARKQTEILSQTRLHLWEFAINHSVEELLQKTLDKVSVITKSTIAFYHLLEADEKTISLQVWSTETSEKFGNLEKCEVHFSIDQSGLWADCIRQRQPIVKNDCLPVFSNKDIPAGHPNISRQLIVPIVRGDRVVAILGIANKLRDYTDQDAKVVQYLADVAWEISTHKMAEQKIHKYNQQIQAIVNSSPTCIIIADKNGCVEHWNPACGRVFGWTSEEVIGKPIPYIIDASESQKLKERVLGGEVLLGLELQRKRKDESKIYVSLSAIALKNEQGVADRSLNFIEDITERKKSEGALKKSHEQLKQTLNGITHAISATIELRDPYTAGHQARVALLAEAIVHEMCLPEELANQIYTAGLLHDIGKICVPSEILSKPGKLSNIEYSLIKNHPQAGHDILNNIDFSYPVAQWVLEHHELLNGSGYPQGLKGDEISLEARILTVADVVEAISSHRPYRASLGIEKALQEINSNRNTLYDNKVVDACLSVFNKGFQFGT